MRGFRATLALSAILFAATAQAQSTLGEVLDKGGKMLTKDELQALIPGSLWQGTSPSGITYKIDMRTDQTLNGTGTNARGSGPVTGTWNITDRNQICTKLTLVSLNQTSESCSFIYQIENELFASPTQSDRTRPVGKRTYTK